MSKPIITSLAWIRKGWAKPIPLEFEEQDEKRLKNLKKAENKLKSKGKLTGVETIKETTKKLEEDLENLDLNIKEAEMEELKDIPVFSDDFKNYYDRTEGEGKNDDDQYPEGFDDISDEENDDFTIHPSDALIACCTTQDENFSNIEMYIFDETNMSLYVHHDIFLSGIPLSIDWLPYRNGQKANFAIVGGFLPEIEIWNLDVMETLEPDSMLGPVGDGTEKYYKNLKKKKNIPSAEHIHTAGVIALNVNPFNHATLASGGEDHKVLLWDLNSDITTKAVRAFNEHKGKVQSVCWNKMEDNVLISGSHDKTIKLYDARVDQSCTTLQVNSEIENIDWSAVNKYQFVSSFENGKIDLYDIRKFDTLLSFKAHKKAATNVSFSNKQEGLFASVGLDCHVKIWDASNLTTNPLDNSVSPALICEKFVKKSTVYIYYFIYRENYSVLHFLKI